MLPMWKCCQFPNPISNWELAIGIGNIGGIGNIPYSSVAFSRKNRAGLFVAGMTVSPEGASG